MGKIITDHYAGSYAEAGKIYLLNLVAGAGFICIVVMLCWVIYAGITGNLRDR